METSIDVMDEIVDLKPDIYTIDEFINLTKINPLSWISYCEIIILENGHISTLCGNHYYTMIKIIEEFEKENVKDIDKDKYNLSLEELSEKYNLVPVWYNYLIIPSNMNSRQKLSLRKLQVQKLVSEYPEIKYL